MNKTYYIASWLQGDGEGVTKVVYDKDSDSIISRSLMDQIKRSSYFARTEDCLFILTEAQMIAPKSGCISCLRISDGEEILIDTMNGIDAGITHLCLSKDERHLYCSGYGTGTLYICDVDGFGKLSNFRIGYTNSGSSINKIRQDRPHIHFSIQSPDLTELCVCDLGTDEILVFDIDERSGDLKKAGSLKTPLGYGPRHMIFSSDGRYAYVLCELNYHLLIYAYEGNGTLEFIRDIDLYPEAPADRRQCSAIKVSRDGRHLFTCNRAADGFDSIDVWDLADQEDPRLIDRFNDVCFPRDISLLNDDYIAVCNQRGDDIQFLRFENDRLRQTGRISGIRQPVSIIEW